MKMLVFVLSVLCLAVEAGSPQESMLDKRITFQLPAHWIVQRRSAGGPREALQLMIPDPDTEDTPDSSNAVISAEPLRSGATLKSFGDSRLQSAEPSFLVLSDVTNGKWRTALSRAQQGNTPYTIIDRFGVDAGYMVALRIAFPITRRKDARWMARTVADCNALIRSLKIRGKNSIAAELENDDEGVSLKDPKKTTKPPKPGK